MLKKEVKVSDVPTIKYLSASVGSVDRLETQEDYTKLKSLYKSSWSDVAWKGDELNSKIVVCSRENAVHNVEVLVSDFSSDSGVITADNVDAKWLKEVQANIGCGNIDNGNVYAPVEAFPDVIYKGGKCDLAAEKVLFSWLTINVPKDAKAGIYTGLVTVTADELETPYVFEYSFEVLDLVQPETSETDTQIQIWQHPFSVAGYYGVAQEDYFTEEHFKYMRSSMKEYRKLGGRDVVANIVEEAWNHQSYYSDPSMVKWTKNNDGTFSFDYTWYDAWINFQIECGVLNPRGGEGQIKCYSIVPWNNQIAYYDETLERMVEQSYVPGAADWKEMWTSFLSDFMKHSKEMGWFDITYISTDERSMEQLEPAVELIESIVDEKGVGFKIASAFNYSDQKDYSFTDKIDDISINLAYVSNTSEKMRNMAAHRRELGLYTTIYTCTGNYPGNFTISDPADNNWTMWYTLAHDTDGFLRWAWDNWVEDAMIDVSYKWWEPGDGWFIYPTEKSEDDNVAYYYSTPRYEMLKKGVRDINKAKYLMEMSEELNVQVKQLVHSLRQPATGSSYGSAVAAKESDRELVFTETARMRQGIIELSRKFIERN